MSFFAWYFFDWLWWFKWGALAWVLCMILLLAEDEIEGWYLRRKSSTSHSRKTSARS